MSDMLTYAQERMVDMNEDELRGLVMVACNQLGLAISGGPDYKDPQDAIESLNKAIQWIFKRFDVAKQLKTCQ